MSSAKRKLQLLFLILVILSANTTVPVLLRPVNNLIHDRVGPEPEFPGDITQAFSKPYRYHLSSFRGEPVTIHYGFRSADLFSSPFFDPESPYLGAFYGAYAFGPDREVDETLLRELVIYDLKGLVLSSFHPSPEVAFVGPKALQTTTPTHASWRPRLSYLQYGWIFPREEGVLATYHYDYFSLETGEGTLTYYALAIDESLVDRTIQTLKEAVANAD